MTGSPLPLSCHPWVSALTEEHLSPWPPSLGPCRALWLLPGLQVVAWQGWRLFQAVPQGGDKCSMQVWGRPGQCVCHWDKPGQCVCVTEQWQCQSAFASSSAAAVFVRVFWKHTKGIWQLLVAVLSADELWGVEECRGQWLNSPPLVPMPSVCSCRSWQCCCPAEGCWQRRVGRQGSSSVEFVLWWMGIGILRVGREKQLMFWFCTAVAPSLMEHALVCGWAFYWVGQHRVQQEMSDCSRNLASSLGIWLYSLSLQLGDHQHFILQCTSQGSSSPWLHHLPYQYISLFNRLGRALPSILLILSLPLSSNSPQKSKGKKSTALGSLESLALCVYKEFVLWVFKSKSF